ncbi:hypothetical protein [Planctomycetes bacterium TBK1r]|uniref:Uncharacterized protein n=1 Tax=Stieleria magnilauensis TaxID=2527963 RepID=A0ABX5XJG1_9BACT|nr:hypothetical protein TBK1r_08350 [Planctomycetes bacterium TBK1r]
MLAHEEQTLIDYTIKLKQQYQSLSEIVDAIEREPGRGVEAINEQMKQIKQTEDLLRPLRERYQEEHEHASGQIKALTDETIDVVKSLMPKLAGLEKASVDSLRRLFPKIQGSVRAVQMQNAYRGNHHA